jgi:general secretion pathway protein G
MIVVVIIGLLAGVVTYSTATYLDKAKRTRAKTDLASLSQAVDHFYLDNSRYPSNQEGLKVLAPQYVKAIPNDPWGRPYVYASPGRSAPFDILSLGADGREGGSGADADISNANLDAAQKPK